MTALISPSTDISTFFMMAPSNTRVNRLARTRTQHTTRVVPSRQLAGWAAIRGLGKREAIKRLELLGQ